MHAMKNMNRKTTNMMNAHGSRRKSTQKTLGPCTCYACLIGKPCNKAKSMKSKLTSVPPKQSGRPRARPSLGPDMSSDADAEDLEDLMSSEGLAIESEDSSNEATSMPGLQNLQTPFYNYRERERDRIESEAAMWLVSFRRWVPMTMSTYVRNHVYVKDHGLGWLLNHGTVDGLRTLN
jgi:hypothetical protein